MADIKDGVGIYCDSVIQYYTPKFNGVITNIIPIIPKWYLDAFNWLEDNKDNIVVLRGYSCEIAEQCYKRFFRYYELSFIDDGKRVRMTCTTGKHSNQQFREYDPKNVKIINVDLKD